MTCNHAMASTALVCCAGNFSTRRMPLRDSGLCWRLPESGIRMQRLPAARFGATGLQDEPD
eukprot:7470151-Alexandrium_andersonii.AAC.1